MSDPLPAFPSLVQTEFLHEILARTREPSPRVVSDILGRAREKKGLALSDVGVLVNLEDPGLIRDLFHAASAVKREIYGERLVFFAPLYVSDHCINDCAYCNFHARNRELARRVRFQSLERRGRGGGQGQGRPGRHDPLHSAGGGRGSGRCVISGKPSPRRMIWAKAY